MGRLKNIEIIDILEQIQRLSKMISLHENSDNNTMLIQYQCLKNDFTEKLNQILDEYDVDIEKLKEVGGERKEDFYAPLTPKNQVNTFITSNSIQSKIFYVSFLNSAESEQNSPIFTVIYDYVFEKEPSMYNLLLSDISYQSYNKSSKLFEERYRCIIKSIKDGLSFNYTSDTKRIDANINISDEELSNPNVLLLSIKNILLKNRLNKSEINTILQKVTFFNITLLYSIGFINDIPNNSKILIRENMISIKKKNYTLVKPNEGSILINGLRESQK